MDFRLFVTLSGAISELSRFASNLCQFVVHIQISQVIIMPLVSDQIQFCFVGTTSLKRFYLVRIDMLQALRCPYSMNFIVGANAAVASLWILGDLLN